MTADQAFQDVLSYVEKSRLNFSIYRTPFSAQLSLKKSFAKHFQEEEGEPLVKKEQNTFEIKNNELEARFKKSAAEIDDYLETIKEKDERIMFLETKCDNLEKVLKVERKKMKKERQKVARKVAIDEFNIKQESTDDDDELDPNIPTSNKLKAHADYSDLEMKYGSEQPCDFCEQRLLSRNRLQVCINAGEEVVPISKASVSVQTVKIEPPEPPVNLFPYPCFYCGLVINSKAEIGQHKPKCHEVQSIVKPAFTEEDVKSCDFCGFKFGTLGGLRNHIRSLHKEMLQAQLMLPT